LLIKGRDEYADPSWDIDRPRFDYSVLTGRGLKEIKRANPAKVRLQRKGTSARSTINHDD
jgi:hypothetical protein